VSPGTLRASTSEARLGPLTVDLYWAGEQVVLELDGWEHHSTRRAFEDDRARDRWLAGHGILCCRMTWRQLHAGALADLVAVLGGRRRVRAA